MLKYPSSGSGSKWKKLIPQLLNQGVFASELVPHPGDEQPLFLDMFVTALLGSFTRFPGLLSGILEFLSHDTPSVIAGRKAIGCPIAAAPTLAPGRL